MCIVCGRRPDIQDLHCGNYYYNQLLEGLYVYSIPVLAISISSKLLFLSSDLPGSHVYSTAFKFCLLFQPRELGFLMT